jgi:hypothetical protein
MKYWVWGNSSTVEFSASVVKPWVSFPTHTHTHTHTKPSMYTTLLMKEILQEFEFLGKEFLDMPSKALPTNFPQKEKSLS